MKPFMSILIMMTVSLLHSMENNYVGSPRHHSNITFNNIGDNKYSPMISKILATCSYRINYNEPNVIGGNSAKPSALKNFKVKSREDLKKIDS